MTLRFASLGSGSRGNALVVECRQTLLMVDCGLALGATVERLGSLGRDPADVTAILVTHEHSDHVQGVARFARRFGTPVWMTPGTASASGNRAPAKLRTLSCHRGLKLGDIEVEPYPVPHDAREPCQFVFSSGGRRLGVITDTGHITTHILERLRGCDALALECNHDLEMLRRGSYPESVKARVASQLGHLNNGQAADLLAQIGHEALQWVMALHLSERNNSPAQVRRTLEAHLTHGHQRVHLAAQDQPSSWLEML